MLIPLIWFFTTLNPFNDHVEIKAQLKTTAPFKDLVAGVTVILKASGKLLDASTTDADGRFEFSLTADVEKKVDIFAVGVDQDTVLIASIKSLKQNNPSMTLYYPAKPNKNIFGKARCLKCHKTDKVYLIRYGDRLPMASRHISASGDTTYSAIVEGHYNAGSCIITTATWYCHRDKVKF